MYFNIIFVLSLNVYTVGASRGNINVKEFTYQCKRHEMWVQSLVRKIPWKRTWQPTPLFWPGESQCKRASLAPKMVKNLPAMWETQNQSMGREGNGNLLQYSCLENPMDRGALQAKIHGVAKSQT